MHVHINIGSNLGDRENNIRRAVASLRQLAVDVNAVRVSDTIESHPWGYDSPNDYINVGMSFDTALSPHQLLARTRDIEKQISDTSHRDAHGNYIDRLIDIDIIAATDANANTTAAASNTNATATAPTAATDAASNATAAETATGTDAASNATTAETATGTETNATTESHAIGSLIRIYTSTLTLPHPRALQRPFVTIPLCQIDLPLYHLLQSPER